MTDPTSIIEPGTGPVGSGRPQPGSASGPDDLLHVPEGQKPPKILGFPIPTDHGAGGILILGDRTRVTFLPNPEGGNDISITVRTKDAYQLGRMVVTYNTQTELYTVDASGGGSIKVRDIKKVEKIWNALPESVKTQFNALGKQQGTAGLYEMDLIGLRAGAANTFNLNDEFVGQKIYTELTFLGLELSAYIHNPQDGIVVSSKINEDSEFGFSPELVWFPDGTRFNIDASFNGNKFWQLDPYQFQDYSATGFFNEPDPGNYGGLTIIPRLEGSEVSAYVATVVDILSNNASKVYGMFDERLGDGETIEQRNINFTDLLSDSNDLSQLEITLGSPFELTKEEYDKINYKYDGIDFDGSMIFPRFSDPVV